MYKYMIRQPTYRYFNVGRFIACFLWAGLRRVGLGYIVNGTLDASNDPTPTA